ATLPSHGKPRSNKLLLVPSLKRNTALWLLPPVNLNGLKACYLI
ncbi:hypothetical protein A2U01_0091835, partial [Trifolium medium]|nr:hypothetical protein [Trifolium medium]